MVHLAFSSCRLTDTALSCRPPVNCNKFRPAAARRIDPRTRAAGGWRPWQAPKWRPVSSNALLGGGPRASGLAPPWLVPEQVKADANCPEREHHLGQIGKRKPRTAPDVVAEGRGGDELKNEPNGEDDTVQSA